MKIWKKAIELLQDKKGNSAIMFLVTSTLFIGVLAFVIDAGLMYAEKSKLQNAVDAMALAAMQDYPKGQTSMLNQAYRYAGLNDLDPLNVQITFADNNKKITVTASKKVTFFFARIFNITDANVDAKASAKVGPIMGANGIRPLAVEQQTFVFGQTYTLKKGAGGGYTGNYGALALGGTGSSIYRNNLMYGYHDNLEIGDLVRIGEDMETEPGNMSGPTYDGIRYILDQDTHSHTDLAKLEKNCPRLIVIPVVDSLDVDGRSTVKIVGFANFFLEEVDYIGGQTEVKGKFIKTLGHGEISDGATDYGMTGIKLVE